MNKLDQTCRLAGVIVLIMLFLTGCGNQSVSDVLHTLQYEKMQNEVVCMSDDRYAHNTLSAQQQIVYDQMLDAILNMKEQVRLSTRNNEDVQLCYQAICADYGQIFWVDSCSCNELLLYGKPYAVDFVVNYAYTPEEVKDYQAKMQPQIDSYLECLAGCESDYEKTEALYRKLIREVAYDMEAENNQNILSVFLGQKTVCQGYACATQYLLQEAGIPCAIITGTAQGQPHAWNLAQLDGDYYFIDVTWGNMDYKSIPGDMALDLSDSIHYGYLNITSQEMNRSHKPLVDFPICECNHTENNYYVKNGLYFDHWDVSGLGAKIAHAYAGKTDRISVKFSNDVLLAQAKQYLIDEQHMKDYCEGITQIYYVQDPDLNILTIYLS